MQRGVSRGSSGSWDGIGVSSSVGDALLSGGGKVDPDTPIWWSLALRCPHARTLGGIYRLPRLC